MFRMLFPKSARLDALVSEQRGAMDHVRVERIDADNCRLVVTNGTALLAVKVQADGEVPEYLPASVIAGTRKAKGKEPLVEVLHQDGRASIGDVSLRTADADVFRGKDYPDWQQVVPTPDPDGVYVGIDVDLLVELCQAMGTRKIVLGVNVSEQEDNGSTLSPITVRPLSHGDVNVEFGLIMPMRIE